ncbi:MAG: 16S rRNA (cytosine(1402)-N(4))-methyltransferase RsmH [Rhodospirillaceae bacterium]|jgi:16S rRNA (cytosine1402-N4)-methyltransferase|nr:16S rRNA (cytosine(1402)-N(4))-methyltransferase RsmH [Rhodospirillaceae bacterium]
MLQISPHVPVLLSETLVGLTPKTDEIFVDGTFGVGGCSCALLDAANCRVFGIDRDPSAIILGKELAKRYNGRLTILSGRFGNMDQLLNDCGINKVDGVTLDLGISSTQLDKAERGFSFKKDGPLDMRMEETGISAADMVNSLSESELSDIFWNFGEERYSNRIARAIVNSRKTQLFARTRQLTDLIHKIVPRTKNGIDSATRTFQGLRIAVNNELEEISRGLLAAERLLNNKGRLAIVSFHSLEDRIVKNFLKIRSCSEAHTNRYSPPPLAIHKPSFRLLTKKPITPSFKEIAENVRARSSRLRLAERTSWPAWSSS